MTRIDYSVTEDKFDIEIRGHAGYAAMGNDIVCAAISVLIQTLMLHMEKVTEEWDALMENGYAHVKGKGEKAVASFETILTGLRAMENQYPQYITISRGAL